MVVSIKQEYYTWLWRNFYWLIAGLVILVANWEYIFAATYTHLNCLPVTSESVVNLYEKKNHILLQA